MKKKPLIIANWKMNKTNSEALFFVESLKQYTKELQKAIVVIAAPFTTLSDLQKALSRINTTDKKLLCLAAQNMYYEKAGAYTGEISCRMIKELGCSYVILGHYERRRYFNETNEIINKKTKYALDNDIIPIVCIGETLEERKSKNFMKVIHTQLEQCLAGLKVSEVRQVVIAYEPVWAIGTGENALPLQVQEIHVFIRTYILEKFSQKVSEEIKIVYGGSVNEHSIKSYLLLSDVNGALVGGASLEVEKFVKLLKNVR